MASISNVAEQKHEARFQLFTQRASKPELIDEILASKEVSYGKTKMAHEMTGQIEKEDRGDMGIEETQQGQNLKKSKKYPKPHRLSKGNVLTIRTSGLLDSVPDHLWTSPASPVRFAIHSQREVKNTFMDKTTLNSSSFLHTVLSGAGRKALKLAHTKDKGFEAISFIGRVGGEANDGIQHILLDGKKTKGYWLDVNLMQSHDEIQNGDLVSLYDRESDIQNNNDLDGQMILCYVYKLLKEKTLRVVALAGKSHIKEFVGRPASDLRVLTPSLISFEDISSKTYRMDIKIKSSDVVSMAPLSMRMLGSEESRDFDIKDKQGRQGFVTEVSNALRLWFLSIEERDRQNTVCDWSQAFVLTLHSPIRKAKSNRTTGKTKEIIQRYFLVPHIYNGCLGKDLIIPGITSKQLYNNAVLRNLEIIASILRPSKFSDPRRHIPIPPRYDTTTDFGKHKRRKYKSLIDVCADIQGYSSKIETVLQPPAGRLFGIISIKDIVAKNLRGQLLMYDEDGEDSSPWEARLSFKIQQGRNLPTFDNETTQEFERTAVSESTYARAYREAFIYPRVEKIDPRIQTVGSEAASERLNRSKRFFGSLSHSKSSKSGGWQAKKRINKMESEHARTVALQTLNFMQEQATDKWDSISGTGFKNNIPTTPGADPPADLAPQFGPDFIIWTIGDDTLKIGESVIKLYVRDTREPGDKALLQKFPRSEHHEIVKKTFLRVELKCRQVEDRSKVYVLGSAQIPMARFLHNRWIGFTLDQGAQRDFSTMASNDPDSKIWESFNSLSAMKKQLYLGAKLKEDFASAYVTKSSREKSSGPSKPWHSKSDLERTKHVLEEFLNDPSRSVLTIMGSRKHINTISSMAHRILQCNIRKNKAKNGLFSLFICKELDEITQFFPRPDHLDDTGQQKDGMPNYEILNPALDDVPWQANCHLKRPDELRAEAKELSTSSDLGVKSAREERLEEALKMALSHIQIQFQAHLKLVDSLSIMHPKTNKKDRDDHILLQSYENRNSMSESQSVKKVLRASKSIMMIKKDPFSSHKLKNSPTGAKEIQRAQSDIPQKSFNFDAKRLRHSEAAIQEYIGPITADTGDGQRAKVVNLNKHPLYGAFEIAKKSRNEKSGSSSTKIGSFNEGDAKLVTDCGLATDDEIILIREGGTENVGSRSTACLNVFPGRVQMHKFQEGITGPYRPSTTTTSRFRSLETWQKLIAKTTDKHVRATISNTAAPLMLISPVCEMCLELRGRSTLSRSDIRAAMSDGARKASRRCLISSQKSTSLNSSMQYKRIGKIVRLNNDETADVLFSSLDDNSILSSSYCSRSHRGQVTRTHIPCKDIEYFDKHSMSKHEVHHSGRKEYNLKCGDIVKAPFSTLITDAPNSIGFLCDVCYDTNQDRNNSAWAEILPPSEIRTSALIDVELNTVWGMKDELDQEPLIVWENLSFGLEPFRRVRSITETDYELLSHSIKDNKAFKIKNVPLLFCRRSWNQESLSSAAVKLFTGHELSFFNTTFNNGISSDASALCTLARRAGEVSRGRRPSFDNTLFEYSLNRKQLPKARGFCDTCAYFETKIAHFIVEYEAKTRNNALDLRGSLKYFLSPVASMLSLALSMQENYASEVQILTHILKGKEPNTKARCIFWAFLNDFITYHAVNFFGEISRFPYEQQKDVKRFAHAGVNINNSSGNHTILIGGVGEKFSPLRPKGAPFYFNPRTKVAEVRQSECVDDLTNVAVFNHVTRKWSLPIIKTSKTSEKNFVRMDHSAVMWENKYVLIFGGHVGAQRDKRGNMIPGKALCDLHILDTEAWTWEMLCEGDSGAPQLGRYGHSAVVSRLPVSESEGEVMLIFGGFTPIMTSKRSQSPFQESGLNSRNGIKYSNKFVADEKGLDDETYLVLNLSSKDGISWISPEVTRLGRREWSTCNAPFSSSKVRFCSTFDGHHLQPPPFAYAYSVSIPGSIGISSSAEIINLQDLPARVLVFGGQIYSKQKDNSDCDNATSMKACQFAWELKYVIEETKLEVDSFRGLSQVKTEIISRRQQLSSVYAKITLQWEKKLCTGMPPPIGGYSRGVYFLNDKVYAAGPKYIYSAKWLDENTSNVKHKNSWHWNRLISNDSPPRPVFDSTLAALSSFRLLLCGGYSPHSDSTHGNGLQHILKLDSKQDDDSNILSSSEIITLEKDRLDALVYEGYIDKTELYKYEVEGHDYEVLHKDVALLKLQRIERRTRRLDHDCLEKKSQVRLTHDFDGMWWVQNFGLEGNPRLLDFRKRLLGQESFFKSMFRTQHELRLEFEEENLITISEEEQILRAQKIKQMELSYEEASTYLNVSVENPAAFLQPDTFFVECLEDTFDPYRTGHVSVIEMMRVCKHVGLVRQLVRIRLRLQFLRRNPFKAADFASKHRYLIGLSKMKEVYRFLDMTSLKFYCEQWFQVYEDASNEDLNSIGTQETWVTFEHAIKSDHSVIRNIEGGLLACCEAYTMITSLGEKIATPPQTVLTWALNIALSHDSVHDDHFSSCIRESAVDLICFTCKTRGGVTRDTALLVIGTFESLVSLWLTGNKLSKSDEYVLIKITSALHYLCVVHELQKFLVSRNLVPVVLLGVSTAMEKADAGRFDSAKDAENKVQLKQSMEKLLKALLSLDNTDINPGNDLLLLMTTKCINLLISAHSAQSRADIQLFQQNIDEGITPNALDTSDAMWDKIVAVAPYLRNFDNRRQAAMSFVQLCEEKLKYLGFEYNDSKGKFRKLLRSTDKKNRSRLSGAKDRLARCKSIYDASVKSLLKMKSDARHVSFLIKDLDEAFAKHIRQQIVRSVNNFNDQDYISDEYFVKKRHELTASSQRLIKRLAAISVDHGDHSLILTNARDLLEEEKTIRGEKKQPGIISDTRLKRGFINMVLETLENIEMTDLKTQVLVKWRLLRILTYGGTAAVHEENIRALIKNASKETETAKSGTESASQELFDSEISATALGGNLQFQDAIPMQLQPTFLTFAFRETYGTSMYMCELFNTHGAVTLTYILSCCSRIRKLEEVMPVPWTLAEKSEEWTERVDEVYFSQNNFSVERYTTLALLLFLRWLSCRLCVAKNMRQYVRHTAREIKMKNPEKRDLLAYSFVRKTRSASENINALITLSSLRSEDACGHGDIIADLADRITDGRMHRLTALPEIDWSEIMDHMEDVTRHAASLDFNSWRLNKEKSKTIHKEEVGRSSLKPWWQTATRIPIDVDDHDPFNKKITAQAAKDVFKTGTSVSASDFSDTSSVAENIGASLGSKQNRENCGSSCKIS